MGAVSGLVDVDSVHSTRLLIDALSHLEGRNRQLALEGLLRTDQRTSALVKHINSDRLKLTEAEIQALRNHPLNAIRKRIDMLELGK